MVGWRRRWLSSATAGMKACPTWPMTAYGDVLHEAGDGLKRINTAEGGKARPLTSSATPSTASQLGGWKPGTPSITRRARWTVIPAP